MRVLSFLILLLPAAYTWWYGRRLLRRVDDPQFAELHARKVIHLASVIGVCLGLSLVASFEHLGIKMLLAFFGATVADYGYRRAVFRESWSFPAYVGHVIRSGTALMGSWILIGLLPELVRAAGDAWVPVAAGLALAIVIAIQLNAWLLFQLLGAREIGYPELEARFAQILMKAGCRTPWIGRAGPKGGFWINAMAVPSLYRQGVIMSHDLLASLGPREATAIFAHEVGHLEQFSRKHVALGQLLQLTFVAVPLILAFWLGPQSYAFGIVAGLWPIAVMLWIGWAASRGRKNEHASDLRALELCGDPHALIDGLTKVHVLGQMPRRWDAGYEVQASHPSLAQRLRAIREAAGLEQPQVAELALLAADGSDRAVILAGDRLFWLAGVPPAGVPPSPPPGTPTATTDVGGGAPDADRLRRSATDRRSILYSDLTDLRLAAGGRKARQLIATDRHGSSMRMPIRLDDVPAVEAALARVDVRLPGTAPGLSKAAAAASTSSVWVRVDAVLLMILGVLSPSSGTLSLASLLVLIRPAQANLAAAGTIAVVCALLGLGALDASAWHDKTRLFTIAAWAWLGGTFLWFAGRRFRARLEEPAWTLWTGLATLGTFAAMSFAFGATRLARALPAMQAHLWARQIPAAVLLSIGLAAMLLTVRRRAARAAAAVLLLIAAAIGASATPWFRDRFGQDAFAGGAPPLASAEGLLTKTRELTVDGYVQHLVLAPDGERLAYSSGWDDGPQPTFHVELPGGGSFTTLEATALEFLDDWRVAALSTGEDGMTLQIVDLLAGPAPVVEIALPQAFAPRLRLDRAIGRWQVVATGEDGDGIVHLAGTVTGSLDRVERHALDGGDLWGGGQYAVDDQGSLLTTRQDFGFGQNPANVWIGWVLTFLARAAPTSEIAAVDGSGRTVLVRTTSNAQCFDPPAGQKAFLCAASDYLATIPILSDEDGTTHLWSIEPGGRPSPVGSLPGSYVQAQVASDGRILLSGFGSPPAIVDLEAGTASSFSRQVAAEPALASLLSEAVEYLGDDDDLSPGELLFESAAPSFAFQSGVLAAALPDGETSTILVYRLP